LLVVLYYDARTYDLNRQAAANLRLRLRGHWDRQDAPVISHYLFLSNALHILDGLSVHRQELKTAYTATVYVKQLLLYAAIGDDIELRSISFPIAAYSSSCLT
jgi:hypothetical protein